MSQSSIGHSPHIRIYSACTNNLVHELPLPLAEYQLVERTIVEKTQRDRPVNMNDIYLTFMEKLETYQEGTVFHKDELCAIYPEKNVLNYLYELLNVLEALGYIRKMGKGTFQWFGSGSDRAAKTLKDLQSIANNNEDLGDINTMTTPMLTEMVMVVFISLGYTNSISKQQILDSIFKDEREKLCTQALKLPKVLKVLEVIGKINHYPPDEDEVLNNDYDSTDRYRYIGHIDECNQFMELEETAVEVKMEVDSDNIIKLSEDDLKLLQQETKPILPMSVNEIVLDGSGSWTIKDYVPVSYNDGQSVKDEVLD